ncbi:MAG: ATP-grasp domain-containing protein [Gemmatimonadaceae bacterium]|nr:ATP-grasp domain-containing protein [Gemmatimonadaceae bacterium]
MSTTVRETVAITGMNAGDNPAPGVGVARSLRLDPTFAGRVIGLGYDALDAGFYTQGLLDGGGILPYPSMGADAFLASMRTLTARFGIRALIPNLDSELRAVSTLEPDLAAEGIGTCVPSLDAIERASKPQLPQLAAAAGISIPDSEAVSSVDGIARIGQHFGFPMVVKGVYYGAWVVESEASAIAAFHHFAATWGVPVIFQRHVAGDEYNVCALGDGRGNMVGAVAMRKLVVTDKGKGWAGVTVSNPLLITLAAKIIGALRWRGPMEVEVLVSGRGEALTDLHVIEINPRFPAWVYLTAAAGQNLPAMCARMALGYPTPTALAPYQAGRMFVRIAMDQIADVSAFGHLSATGILPEPPRVTQ